jgi:hypothetical protein
MKPCPSCSNPLAANATQCPRCGHVRQTGRGIVAAALLGVLIFLALAYLVRN